MDELLANRPDLRKRYQNQFKEMPHDKSIEAIDFAQTLPQTKRSKQTTENTTQVGSIYIDKDAFKDESIQVQEVQVSGQDIGMTILEQQEDQEEKLKDSLILNMVNLGDNWDSQQKLKSVKKALCLIQNPIIKLLDDQINNPP